MQFSTTINQNPPLQKPWIKRFISQPHQLFFTSAIFFAIFIMIFSLLSYLGKSTIDFTLIHGFGMNYAIFTNAFLGFLITVIPKFNGSPAINSKQYLIPWIIYQVSIFITLFINIYIGKLLLSLVIFYFARMFYFHIKIGKAISKTDSYNINYVLALGATLLLIETTFSLNLNILIFFAYLLTMVFLVAIKMVPSFYFVYTKINPWQKPPYIQIISIILFSLLGLSLQFASKDLTMIVSLLCIVFFGYVLYKLNIYKKTTAIITILVIPFFWLELGFISLFAELYFDLYSLKLYLHIFALGFINTLLIGFSSRVVMGHAVPAQKIFADNITKALFVLTQIIIITRAFSSIAYINISDSFMIFLHISTTLWLVLFLVWTFRYGKTLLNI